MSALITDELVAMANEAFNDIYDGPGSQAQAMRAALAIAVPEIGRACAEVAREVGAEPPARGVLNAVGIRMGAASCELRIRTLTGASQ